MISYINYIRPLLSVCLIISCMCYHLTTHAATRQSDIKQQFTPKDFQHWLNIARIAQATYQSEKDLVAALASSGYTLDRLEQIPGFSVSFVLATNDKTRNHLVAVRGTSNVENIIVDAAFVLVPDKLSGVDIHQGFLLSARDIYELLQPAIKTGYTINTVGHSLGGAAALILAMMLDAQGHTIGEVITFGQPKVTNINGSRKFRHLDVKRLVTPKDIVPLVPPLDPMDFMNLSIFWHQGTEVILYNDNQYAVLQGTGSMRRAIDFLNDSPSKQHLNNHYISTYIRHLESKLDSAVQIKYQSDFDLSDWMEGFKSTRNE